MPADQALPAPVTSLTGQLKAGLSAPICLTWELTYTCNLQCVHCLSASGRCMAAKFFTGLPLAGPDPECVLGHGERELANVCLPDRPQAGPGHSRRPAPVFVPLGRIAPRAAT